MLCLFRFDNGYHNPNTRIRNFIKNDIKSFIVVGLVVVDGDLLPVPGVVRPVLELVLVLV